MPAPTSSPRLFAFLRQLNVVCALVIFAVAAMALAGAWYFQAIGYVPCELCFKERWAYYTALPLCALIIALLYVRQPLMISFLFCLIGLVFFANAAFGVYHVGVEFRWWPGPSSCTGSMATGAPVSADFLKALGTVKIVPCDVATLFVLGLSLAAWNALVSFGLSVFALFAAVVQAVQSFTIEPQTTPSGNPIPLDLDI